MLSDVIGLIPDEQALLELINKFDKLLRKYSRMLDYEDAYNDLVLFFIELVTALKTSDVGMKSDAYIVNYIAVSIKNQYIKMSKAHEANKVILFSDLSEFQI